MKILIDENVHHGFRKILTGHEIYSVQFMGWAGVKNGKLLDLANEKFDILLTLDTGIRYENKLTGRKIAVITLISKFVKMDDLMPLVPALLIALNHIRPGEIIRGCLKIIIMTFLGVSISNTEYITSRIS